MQYFPPPRPPDLKHVAALPWEVKSLIFLLSWDNGVFLGHSVEALRWHEKHTFNNYKLFYVMKYSCQNLVAYSSAELDVLHRTCPRHLTKCFPKFYMWWRSNSLMHFLTAVACVPLLFRTALVYQKSKTLKCQQLPHCVCYICYGLVLLYTQLGEWYVATKITVQTAKST